MISYSDRSKAIELIEEAVHSGARLIKACEVLKITERTIFRWKKELKEKGKTEDCRPLVIRNAPKNKLDSEEIEAILNVVNSEEYKDKPVSQIVPDLADKGIYIASESTFYRVLKSNKMQTHRGLSKEPSKREIPTHIATGPNQVWVWDITYLKGAIKGSFYYLYLVSDLWSRKIVGWEVWQEQNTNNASILIKRAAFSEGRLSTQPMVLHSDNGSPMKGATMLATLQALGITPSFSRPRVSNDNAFAESLFKTLKYRSNFQEQGFKSIADARLWCEQFVKWYNFDHHHSGINYVTPFQRHSGQDKVILEQRKKVYEIAKQNHPERWNGRETRNCLALETVALNPVKTSEIKVFYELQKEAS